MSGSAGSIVVEAWVPEALEEHLPELFACLPVLGTEIGKTDSDHGVPLKVYLAVDDLEGAHQVEAVLSSRGGTKIQRQVISGQDWMAAYREVVKPMPIGRTWWLDPHPATPTPAPPGRTRIVIEPRMAFGTGSHETTQLMLEVIENRRLEGLSVLDVGTGSGILALACLSRRASWVLGLDIDAQSVWVARETAIAQEKVWRPHFAVGSVDCLSGGAFDLVLCNMIMERFSPLLHDLSAILEGGGTMLLSGLLGEQRAEVIGRLQALGCRVEDERCLAEWVCLEVRR